MSEELIAAEALSLSLPTCLADVSGGLLPGIFGLGERLTIRYVLRGGLFLSPVVVSY
jgi:hypothetical protein